MKTEQETFWKGSFGNEYIDRNKGDRFLAIAKENLENGLRKASNISSVIELGSNIGNNIVTLNQMISSLDAVAVEINPIAAEQLQKLDICDVKNESILDFKSDRTFDLSFTSGVLIHISPDHLNEVYKTLYETSHKYILILEYYNHQPEEILYRGHEAKLYRRDFCKDIMDEYPDLKLIDYGFLYHNTPDSPRKEDLYWFLMEK